MIGGAVDFLKNILIDEFVNYFTINSIVIFIGT